MLDTKKHRYKVSCPKVEVAKARNICRVCRRPIVKGEKYLKSFFIDLCSHGVGFRKFGFHETMKFCKDCSIELLRMKDQNLILTNKHEENVLDAIYKLLSVKRDRFSMLKGIDPLEDYLKEHNFKK